MGDKEDYLTSYRMFFENFAATVNPEDQLPVHIAGYTITESELAGEVLYWTTQYLSEKQCPQTLMTPLRRIILDEVQTASKKQPNEYGYKSDEAVYIALRLMQAVTARVNDVCLRYLDNSRLDTLPPPPPLELRDLKTVSCATKNSRRAMEDRHVEIGNLEALFGIETTEPTSFYAVYDGHAGSAAATYCAAHLHQYLAESAHFRNDLRRAMRDAFLRTDAEFIRKTNQERANGGSTAVAVCVRGQRLIAAWAGDSLALLAKRMRLMQLVRPHKPDRQDEKDRIESSGGTVMYWGTWRVNGQLAVSRAIGDAQYKPYVTARPEIATVELDGDEDFVVVACDGLWDFVSEDDVALTVYRQLAADPDDLKAVTKRLVVLAKRQGSADNISIILVFLKEPRDIVADNCPPMDLGLDNAMVNAPPFTIDTEACKRQADAAAAVADSVSGECADAEAEADAEVGDNGVDNSDSDSEDLGPETAVDADDLDAEKNHEPQPPTPPAHAGPLPARPLSPAPSRATVPLARPTRPRLRPSRSRSLNVRRICATRRNFILPLFSGLLSTYLRLDYNAASENLCSEITVNVEEGHVDGALVDNVAESGDESEDEWNYFKGEGEREEHNPSEEADDPPRSETPCQDTSAWESSSVDMNSSPLNPDAPVFVPGGVAGADVLLAESPRKPLPMDDIELPDVAQFQTEAVVRPAELLDLDNCDQLNGHHNVSLDEAVKEHLNGNDKGDMDSLGFGFNVGIEPEKVKDTGLIQDFERIQKDTTDFCNIQVFQTHTETNPFAVEGDDELFERLKNKERDPMSMSFYQEKDDDTCERLSNKNESHVDLNAVQPLPDSDDEDIQPNGICEIESPNDMNKENISPDQQRELFEPSADVQEPNNDIIRFEDRPGNLDSFGQDNFVEYNARSNNMESYSNIEFECSNMTQDTVLQTDTPESHKLLFEQIPEIPDGKSSELGFTNDEAQDPSESEKEGRAFTPQDETSQDVEMESKLEDSPCDETQPHLGVDIDPFESEGSPLQDIQGTKSPELPVSAAPPVDELLDKAITPEPSHIMESDIGEKEDIESQHDDLAPVDIIQLESVETYVVETETPVIKLDTDHLTQEVMEDKFNAECTMPSESRLPSQSPLPNAFVPGESPVVTSHLITDTISPRESPLPAESPVPPESPLQNDTLMESPSKEELPVESLLPGESLLPRESPLPNESLIPAESLLPSESSLQRESPLPSESPLPRERSLPRESPLPDELDMLQGESQQPDADLLGEIETETAVTSVEPPVEVEIMLPAESPLPADVPLPRESPLPTESPLPAASPIPTETQPEASPIPTETLVASHIPAETDTAASPIPTETLETISPTPNETLAASPIPAEVLTAASPTPVEMAPAASPVPIETLHVASPIPTEIAPADSPIPTEPITVASSVPSEAHIPASPIPTEGAVTASPIPTESLPAVSPTSVEIVPAASPIPTESAPAASPTPMESVPATSPIPECVPAGSPIPTEAISAAPIPAETLAPAPAEVPLAPSPAPEHIAAVSPGPIEQAAEAKEVVPVFTPAHGTCVSPPVVEAEEAFAAEESERRAVTSAAPDLLPESATPRSDLVTDVDIGIPESRAQEICVPVTSEILPEEAVQPPAAATPPPTPAVVGSAPPLNDTPMAADAPAPETSVIPAVAVAAVAAAAATAVGAAAVKSATKTTAKRSPTTATAKRDARTPKSASKPTAARTPTAAAKRPTSSTPAARTPTAKAPTPAARTPTATKSMTAAAKPTTPTARLAAAKPAPARTTPAKPASPVKAPTARAAPTKPDTAAAKQAAPARAAPVPRPISKAPARPAATKTEVKPATAAAPAARPAAAKPDAKTTTSRPAPRAAPLPKLAPKPLEKKPLPNGDVKDPKPISKPAPRPAPAAARPAPRPAPRTTAPPATTKPAVPKSTLTARAPLDKQSKDLANKRITAKAAPPRTAPAKTTTGTKKPVQKKPLESVKKDAAPAANGLANGDALCKPPPSPPPADNALLPDVIA